MGTHWDGSVIAWERGGTFPYSTFLTVFNSSWDQWRTIPTQGTFPNDAYLYNYARTYQCYFTGSGPAADYVSASDLYNVNQPPNSYSVWGYKNPDPSSLWPGGVISITDDGQLVETISVDRRDGPDGDAEFNPYGYANRGFPDGVTPTPYTYREEVPRITQGTNVVFAARVDGSANNVLMRLDGGMQINSAVHNHPGCPYDGEWRDNPPGCAHDMVLGFEGVNFVQRIWPEIRGGEHRQLPDRHPGGDQLPSDHRPGQRDQLPAGHDQRLWHGLRRTGLGVPRHGGVDGCRQRRRGGGFRAG
jgi:hypothetical protein